MTIFSGFYQLVEKASQYSDLANKYFDKSIGLKYESDEWQALRLISKIYHKKVDGYWLRADHELQRASKYQKTKEA